MNCNSYLPFYCHMCQQQVCSSNATMPHIPIGSSAHETPMSALYASYDLNQQCEQEFLYIYILYNWHMSLNINACHSRHVFPTTLVI